MNRENKGFVVHEVKEMAVFLVLGFIMAVVVPLSAGFAFGAFSESFVGGRALQFGDFLVTYQMYYIFIVFGLFGTLALKGAELLLTRGDSNIARQKSPFPFAVAYLHDPEKDGLLYNLFAFMKLKLNPMKWSLSMFRTFIIAILVFGSLGVFQVFTNTQFVALPQSVFNVNNFYDVLFTVEPPAFAETTLAILFFSVLMGLWAYVTSRFKIPVGVFWVIALLLICPFMGLSWMSFHGLVYGGSSVALFTTFLFGWIGSTITLLFGSFIWWYVWHFMNNLFAKLSQVVQANEDVIFVSVIVLIVLLVLWVVGEVLLFRVRSKSQVADPKF